MQPTAGPRLCQETKEESLLVCFRRSPWARGGKSVRAAAAGARAIGRPETAHLFLPSPYLQRQAWEGGQGGQPLCPALRWAPPPGAGRGAALETPGRGGRLFGAGGTRVQLRLSRPPSIWRGVRLRACCAHARGPPRTGGSPDPPTPRPATLAAATLPSRPSAPVPEGGRPGSHQAVCLQTVPQQSALGCLPGRQQGSDPAPALGHMPPLLPPRGREPAFCLSAVRRGVFIDGAAVLRCVRFQLLRCAPQDARLTRGRSEARLLPRPARSTLWAGPRVSLPGRGSGTCCPRDPCKMAHAKDQSGQGR